MTNTQIFIAAGGIGKRLGDITKNTPKSMIEINGKPIIEHIIDTALKAEVNQIVVATDCNKDVLENYVKEKYRNVDFEKNCFEPLIKGFLNSCKIRRPEIIIGVNGDTVYNHSSISKMIKLIESNNDADGALLLTNVKKRINTSNWIYWRHEIRNGILVDMSEVHGHHIDTEYIMSVFKYPSLMNISDNFTKDLCDYKTMPFKCYSFGWDYILRIALWKNLRIVTDVSSDLSLNINYPIDIEVSKYFFNDPEYFRKIRTGTA